MNSNLQYKIDICFCISISQSISTLKVFLKEKNMMDLFTEILNAYRYLDKNVEFCRFRLIGFNCTNGYIFESTFFLIPEKEDQLDNIVTKSFISENFQNVGHELYALGLSIKSDWVRDGDRQRHIIVVWSDASTHPLEKGAGSSNGHYPMGMPKDFNELTGWWDGQSYMSNHSAKRLIVFAPDSNAWTNISTHWENTVHYPLKVGEGLAEVDYKNILSAIVNSI